MAFASMLLLIASHLPSTTHAFAASPTRRSVRIKPTFNTAVITKPRTSIHRTSSFTKLYAEEDSNDNDITPLSLAESDSTILGIAGIIASVIMIYSESVLFQTGCGLPAGPAGLVGAAEGLSYLSVVGLVGYSVYTKIRTGSGLPAGPGGILGAAEGLAYLAIFAGFWVLVAQVTNYGYIPNAVPMDGGMCK